MGPCCWSFPDARGDAGGGVRVAVCGDLGGRERSTRPLHGDPTALGCQGAFLGSVTVDGYPEVSEDGESFVDDGSRVIVTIHDVTGAIVQQLPGTGAPPVTGIRMTPGVPGFPQGTLAAGTPVAGTPTP
jgi:hypothetical protein